MGFESVGKTHMIEAYEAYQAWGIVAKTSQLERKYPWVRVGTGGSLPTETIAPVTTTSETGSGHLDEITLVKASQAISEEIQLDKLLSAIMDIALESAGAQKGSLILKKEGGLQIVAVGDKEKEEAPDLSGIPVDSDEFVPLSIVQYVERTGKNVVIDNAMDDARFSRSEYILTNKPRSVLCSAINKQGELLGLLYLENNSVSGAFTKERLEILNMLSGQAAISIENALLYANLEEKVEERTRDLNTALQNVNRLKEQQDGDYFLTSLLLRPLGVKNVRSEFVEVDFFLKQKKEFQFRKRSHAIGGDINIAHSISLGGEDYTVCLNGDAMGKSSQGAGGVLVLGTAFEVVIDRTKSSKETALLSPEEWLRQTFLELNQVFLGLNGSMLMSIVLSILHDRTGQFWFMNAEHPWVVLYRDGKASFLDKELHQHKLGSQEAVEIRDKLYIERFQLQPGDIVISGSDGRDDIRIGDEDGVRVINEDETLFLEHVEKGEGNLEKIATVIQEWGELTDDFSLLKILYLADKSD